MAATNGSIQGFAKARRLGLLDSKHTAVFVCDLQEKFEPSILHFKTIVNNTGRVLEAAEILGIPVLATEQYPKVTVLNVSAQKMAISTIFDRVLARQWTS